MISFSNPWWEQPKGNKKEVIYILSRDWMPRPGLHCFLLPTQFSFLAVPLWISSRDWSETDTAHTNTANTTFLWVLNIVADPTLNVFVSPDFTVTNVRLCHPCRPQGKDGKQMFSSQFWWTGLIVNCTNPGFPERNSPVKLMQYSLSVSTRAAKWKHTFWEGPNEHLKRRKYRLEKSTISLNLKFYRAEYCIVSCNLEQQGMIVLHKAQ